jgi:hypothetical protein
MTTVKDLRGQLASIKHRVLQEMGDDFLKGLEIRKENGAYCLVDQMEDGAYFERSRWFDTAKGMAIFLYAFEKGIFIIRNG